MLHAVTNSQPTSETVIAGIMPYEAPKGIKEVANDNPSQGVIISGTYHISSTEGEAMPTVEVATVMRTASALVALFCAFSWGLWNLSGFYIIDPFFSLLFMAIAALFYAEGVWLTKLWNHK